MSALLLGSISTVADTSERQRDAFNQAFAQHGLDWSWDRDDYQAMLASSGGQARIAEYARSRGQTVDAAAIHQAKSAIFQDSLADGELAPRAGVLDIIHGAKSHGWKVGLVTTTSPGNITALLGSLSPQLSTADFDVIVDSSSVGQPKPDGAAYTYALQALSENAADCLAVEDNADGLRAAVAAGLACVAFPNENTGGQDFSAASQRVGQLDAELLQAGRTTQEAS